MTPSFELNLEHSANKGVLRYLSRNGTKTSPPLRKPESVPYPYYTLGSHPEVVERLWDQLGSALPVDSRCIVYGTPALVHPSTGIVIAVGLGTAYALRVPADAREEALKAGAKTVHVYATSRTTLDLAEQFGPDWVFGRWLKEEVTWCLRLHKSLGQS